MSPYAPEPANEDLYTRLVKGAQDLTSSRSAYTGHDKFDAFQAQYNSLREQYVEGYESLGRERCKRLDSLLLAVKQYLDGTWDVVMIREQNGISPKRRIRKPRAK